MILQYVVLIFFKTTICSKKLYIKFDIVKLSIVGLIPQKIYDKINLRRFDYQLAGALKIQLKEL
tara:strand:+ start:470 stop:661 length:192 start_codon:yes stop_codon:yes gene_type:complete